MFISPLVPGDDVVHILVSQGNNFTFKIVIPEDHPPGLYWYHPHSYKNSVGIYNMNYILNYILLFLLYLLFILYNDLGSSCSWWCFRCCRC